MDASTNRQTWTDTPNVHEEPWMRLSGWHQKNVSD